MDDFNIFQVAAIALILALLAGRMANKKATTFFKRRRIKNALPGAILRKRSALPTAKKCPNCSDNQPMAALVCDACDYNFLSGTVGSRLKLLQAPEH